MKQTSASLPAGLTEDIHQHDAANTKELHQQLKFLYLSNEPYMNCLERKTLTAIH